MYQIVYVYKGKVHNTILTKCSTYAQAKASILDQFPGAKIKYGWFVKV